MPSALSAVAKCFLLLLVFWQFSASARAANITPDGGAYTLAPVHSSIDGIECITADDVDEEPLQVCDNSSDSPGNSDQGPNVWVDKATIPSRTNKKPIHFAETRFEVVVTKDELATDPVLLFPIHCFYSVHEHIRERAPPSLA